MTDEEQGTQDSERKRQTWKIKRRLHELTSSQLFLVAESIGPVTGLDTQGL